MSDKASDKAVEGRPVINLLSSDIPEDGRGRGLLSAITSGMEEEGVPWNSSVETGKTAQELAQLGAERSQLGVGIGVDATLSIAVYFYSLNKTQPLFFVSGEQVEPEQARLTGINAARLVKRIPFKEAPPVRRARGRAPGTWYPVRLMFAGPPLEETGQE